MKLPLSVLHEWLSDQGFNCESSISRNDPIEGIRTVKTETATKNYALVSKDKNGLCKSATIRYYEDLIIVEQVDYNELLNSIMECFEYYNQWERDLLKNMMNKDPLQLLLDVAARVLKYPTVIVNIYSRALAISGWDEPVNTHFDYIKKHGTFQIEGVKGIQKRSDADNIYSSKNALYLEAEYSNGQQIYSKRIRSNIWVNNNLAGLIIAFDPGTGFRKTDLYFMDYFTTFVQKCFETNNNHFSESVLSKYLYKMISLEYFEDIDLFYELKNMKWSSDDIYVVMRIEYRKQFNISPYIISNIQNINLALRECCSFIYGNGITILVNISRISNKQRYLKDLVDILDRDLFIIGVSYQFTNIKQFGTYYRQSCSAVHYGRYLQRDNPVLSKDIALAEISRLSKNNEDLSVFIHNDIQALIEYDNKHQTDLAKSLFHYLLYGENSTNSANALSIHRNTMNYRISRIRNLISLDIDNKSDSILLLVSCILYGFRP